MKVVMRPTVHLAVSACRLTYPFTHPIIYLITHLFANLPLVRDIFLIQHDEFAIVIGAKIKFQVQRFGLPFGT